MISISYGSTEMQGGMVECAPGAGYHNPAPDQFLVEVVDRETHEPLPDPTPEQRERMLVIFDMLISLFERAYLVAWKPRMTEPERRRWNSWDDYMREWCRREDFRHALPLLLRGEDPGFQSYIRRVADEERAATASTT